MIEREILFLTQQKFLAADPEDGSLAQIHLEDDILSSALKVQGIRTRRVDWASPSVVWSEAPLALFRTPWDYYHRYTEFVAWLDRVESQTCFVNDLSTIRWNMDKHYLLDLEARGIPIVPTILLETGEPRPLEQLVAECGWEDVIVKPAVSGGARHTWRMRSDEAALHHSRFADLIREEAMLLQPFQDMILDEGELSLILLDGVCTHAVQKKPKSGDFRVQDDFGGTVRRIDPSPEARAAAEAVVQAVPGGPLYARIDLVAGEGGWLLMEAEVIEPELFFRFRPEAAAVLAGAIARRLAERHTQPIVR